MECLVRPARDEDANDISAVVIRTLRETNARDYASEIIARLEYNFSPNAVLAMIGRRTVLVAVMDGRVVGTASLDGDKIRTVFVSPDVQTRGVGKQLMSEIVLTARARGIALLTVHSSISAETFYSQLGFNAVRDSYFGEERTIVMEQSLEGSQARPDSLSVG